MSKIDRPMKRWIVRYDDGPSSGCPVMEYRCFAYDAEHAEDKFYDDPMAEGFVVLSVDRPRRPCGKVDTQFDRKPDTYVGI